MHGPSGLPMIDFDGHPRVLACRPPIHDYESKCFSTAFPTMPRGEWKDVDFEEWAGKVLDQNGHGSCVGHGSVKSFTIAYREAGYEPLDFSACYIYGMINGGVDQGAVVSDALDLLRDRGVCLESTVTPGQIYSRTFPAKAATEAALYKALGFWKLSTFDMIATAVQLRFGVSFGIMIGGNFTDTDSEGRVPARMSGGGGGHCMCAVGLKKFGSDWFLKVRNSWGTRFGIGGNCYIPERYFEGENDHWAIRVTTSPSKPPALVV
jgi:hypothetical protein